MRPTCGPDGARVNSGRARSIEAAPRFAPVRVRRLAFAHLHRPAVRTLLDCSACFAAAGLRRRARRRRSRRRRRSGTRRRPLAALAAQHVVVAADLSRCASRDPTRLGRSRSARRASSCDRSTTRSRAELARARARRRSGSSPPTSRASAAAQPDLRGRSVRARGRAASRRRRRGRARVRRSARDAAPHDGRAARARALVLMPVELRFEKDPDGSGNCRRSALALLDGRAGRGRAGSARCAARPAADVLAARSLASLAAHLADLIAAP